MGKMNLELQHRPLNKIHSLSENKIKLSCSV